jgi:hypothetical protein
MTKLSCGLIAVLLLSISTVFAQDIAIAYRKGAHWGYADTLGNVVIEPVYDEVVRGWTPMTKLLVAKNQKWGVVSEKGKVTVPLEHSYVTQIKEGFFFTGTKTENDDYLNGLYNSKGKLLIKAERQDINFYNDRIIIIRSPSPLKRSGVALLNTSGSKITWLIPRTNRTIYSSASDSVIFVETETKTIQYKVSRTNELTKLTESDLLLDDAVMFEEVISNEDTYHGPIYDMSVNLAIRDTVNAKGDQSFDLLKKTELNRKKEESTVLEGCEHITIVQYPNGYKEDFYSEKKKRAVTDQWAIIRKDGKYGAFFSVPKDTFIPFQYDAIGQELLPYRCQTIVLKAKRNGKWGLIDLNNKIITDFAFDDILLSNDYYGSNFKRCFEFKQGLIVRKGARYHLLTESKTDIYPKGFERAMNSQRPGQGLSLFEGNKKGYYYWGHLFLPSYEGDGAFGDVDTGSYTLVRIVDKDKKLLGFVDKKGIVYFKD